MINRRRVCGGKSLPYDAEIEYLESSGTQYIDTLYKPSNNSEFDICFYWTASVSGESDITQQCLFGLNDNGIWANVMGNYSSSSELYWADCANVGAGLVRNQVCNVSLKGNVITRPDGATYTVSKTYSALYMNLYLFCRNQYGPTRYCNGARIYYAKFWENGTLVRDFIPVRVGTTGYLYDKVSKQLFANAGTGDFILGPDV